MNGDRKMSPLERQQFIVSVLKEATSPVSGRDLANKTKVSRQVIVQDISVLKAKNEPIVSTSQGYIYLDKQKENAPFRKVIVCKHGPEQTLDELYTIVDHGVTVKDVIVEHAVYGKLTAPIGVTSRKEADAFFHRIKETNAPYLLTLTKGIHQHTLEADSMDKIEAACSALKKAGFCI